MTSDVAASFICVCVRVCCSWCREVSGYHNEIFITLVSDFSLEIYMLPDDDMQCAIETCRSSESVLMYIILD
jgi:hypothetical protein